MNPRWLHRNLSRIQPPSTTSTYRPFWAISVFPWETTIAPSLSFLFTPSPPSSVLHTSETGPFKTYSCNPYRRAGNSISSLLCSQHLKECLAQGWWSINTYWITSLLCFPSLRVKAFSFRTRPTGQVLPTTSLHLPLSPYLITYDLTFCYPDSSPILLDSSIPTTHWTHSHLHMLFCTCCSYRLEHSAPTKPHDSPPHSCLSSNVTFPVRASLMIPQPSLFPFPCLFYSVALFWDTICNLFITFISAPPHPSN